MCFKIFDVIKIFDVVKFDVVKKCIKCWKKKWIKLCVKTESTLFLICVLKLVTVAHTPNRHVAEKVDDQE